MYSQDVPRMPLKLTTKRRAGQSPDGKRAEARSRSNGIPEITVARVARRKAASVHNNTTGDRVRDIFERGELRDTYEEAGRDYGRLLIDSTDRERLLRDSAAMMKCVQTPWGIRFSCWVLQLFAQQFPEPLLLNLDLLGRSLVAISKAASRQDDVLEIHAMATSTLATLQHELPMHNRYPRFFHPLLAPVMPFVSHSTNDQFWALMLVDAVIRSSEDLLLGVTGTISGPCNGELDETLQPAFTAVTELFLGFPAAVLPEAQPALLKTFGTVLDMVLLLASYHAPLYSVGDLLPVTCEKVLQKCMGIISSKNWKVRHGILCIAKVLCKGGVGSRWAPSQTAVEKLKTFAKKVSKTDTVEEVREAAKEVLQDLGPAGVFKHEDADECADCGKVPLSTADVFCAYCGMKRGNAPAASPPPVPACMSTLDKVSLALLSPTEVEDDPRHFVNLLDNLKIEDKEKVLLNISRRVGWAASGERDALAQCLFCVFISFPAEHRFEFNSTQIRCLKGVLRLLRDSRFSEESSMFIRRLDVYS